MFPLASLCLLHHLSNGAVNTDSVFVQSFKLLRLKVHDNVLVITRPSSHATKSSGTSSLFEGQVEVKAKAQSWCLAPLKEGLEFLVYGLSWS